MSFSEQSLRLGKGDSFAAVELFHPLTDGCDGFGALQPVQQGLITAGILNHECGPAVNSQNQRGFPGFEPPDISLEIALKLGDRANLAKIDHAVPPFSSIL